MLYVAATAVFPAVPRWRCCWRSTGARNRRTLPTLSTAQILQWADAHHDNTGRWPNTASGPVDGALGQTWAAINTALHTGGRGLRGGTSLGTLLAKRRHAPQGLRRAALTVTSILAWADEHHRRTGKWPTNQSGPVRDSGAYLVRN